MDPEQDFTPTVEEIKAAIDSEEPDPLISTLTTEEEKRVAARILPGIMARIGARMEADNARKMAAQTQQLIEQNDRMMHDEVEKLRKAIKPPEPAELEQLLSQEYGEIKIELPLKAGKKTCILRELPQSCEKRMVDIMTKRILPQIKEIAAADWAGMFRPEFQR